MGDHRCSPTVHKSPATARLTIGIAVHGHSYTLPRLGISVADSPWKMNDDSPCGGVRIHNTFFRVVRVMVRVRIVRANPNPNPNPNPY